MADHRILSNRRIASRFSPWACCAAFTTNVVAKPLKLEKEQIKIGFIKLTDMVPLAVAYEKGFFEDEGLYVTLEPQANWKVVLDRVITGELDASHMLAGQPLGATIGIGTKADIITAFSMDLNGNAITVSNAVWQQMLPNVPKDAQGKPVRPVKANALKPVIEQFKAAGKPFRMGVVFPVSTHNYELRYWLASGGVHPGFYSPSDVTGQIRADVLISVTPPPQMPATHGGRHHQRLLRGRALEPAGHLQEGGGAGDHRLRDLEEQSGEGHRRHPGLGRQEPEHAPGDDQGAAARRGLAGRQSRQPQGGRGADLAVAVRGRRRARDLRQHDRDLRIRARARSARCPTSTCSTAITPPIRSTATPSGT